MRRPAARRTGGQRRRGGGRPPGAAAVLAVLALSGIPVEGAFAQQPAPAIPTLARDTARPPARVMVLGVFHFHNPNADYAQFEGIDVLTPERQAEIEAVVDRLADFEPTKVAVERPTEQADSLDARFARYRAGDFELTRNEVHQLGFRLAARLGHEAVYPVDYRVAFRLDSILAYARDREPATVERFDAYIGEIVEMFDRMQREETIGANLRFMNEPENVLRTHEPYAVQAVVGAGDGYVGARMVAGWYERNLAIFANLARITERGDRVLFIVGAGHTPILRELVRTHPDMELAEAVDYLP